VRGDVTGLVTQEQFAILEPDAGGAQPMTERVLEIMQPNGLESLRTGSPELARVARWCRSWYIPTSGGLIDITPKRLTLCAAPRPQHLLSSLRDEPLPRRLLLPLFFDSQLLSRSWNEQ